MYEYILQRKLILSKIGQELALRPLLFPAAISLLLVLTGSCSAALVSGMVFLVLFFVSEDKRYRLMFSISAVLALYIFSVFLMCERKITDCYVKDLECYVLKTELKMDGSSRVCLYSREFGRLMMYGTSGEIFPGETVLVSGSVAVPSPPTNPGQYDYRSYLFSRGISGTLYQERLEVTDRGSFLTFVISGILRSSYDVRTKVSSLFGDMSAEACSIFMGDTTLLDDETQRSFRITGCAHLMAVSGTHFSGFLIAFPFVIGSLGLRKRRAFILHSILCVLMGIFTGWSESVTRAAFMSIAAFSSRDHLSGMSMASIAICLTDPYSLNSSGFLMSFSAGLSIRLFGRKLDEKLESIKVPSSVRALLVPVLSAQIGMMPFMTANSYRIGLLNLMVCSLASLMAQLACIFFLPSVILSLLTGPLFMEPVLIILKILFGFLDLYAPLALLSPKVNGGMIFLILCIIPCVILEARMKILYKKIFPLMICISLGIMVPSFVLEPEATVVFIDVGQGDCCLIISGDRSVLIDGGTTENGPVVSSVLDYYGIDRVDIAVMTHLDEDHMGGILYLFEKGRVREVLTSFPEGASISCKGLYQGDRIELGEDLYLSCIWPLCSSYHDGENEDSIVLLMGSPSCSILFTGDAGMETEEKMLQLGLLTDVDILKVAHHGSRYSTGEDFLSIVMPEYSVISVGRNNPYGHPTEETLSRLDDISTMVYRTSENGAVKVDIYDGFYSIRPFLR